MDEVAIERRIAPRVNPRADAAPYGSGSPAVNRSISAGVLGQAALVPDRPEPGPGQAPLVREGHLGREGRRRVDVDRLARSGSGRRLAGGRGGAGRRAARPSRRSPGGTPRPARSRRAAGVIDGIGQQVHVAAREPGLAPAGGRRPDDRARHRPRRRRTAAGRAAAGRPARPAPRTGRATCAATGPRRRSGPAAPRRPDPSDPCGSRSPSGRSGPRRPPRPRPPSPPRARGRPSRPTPCRPGPRRRTRRPEIRHEPAVGRHERRVERLDVHVDPVHAEVGGAARRATR